MSEQHRTVSSESEELILVDRDDNEFGYTSKSDAHDGGGILHRAFSVFLFNDAGELLLQQRAREKRLWGGYWSNSCCSHPRRGETLPVATSRRLLDEEFEHFPERFTPWFKQEWRELNENYVEQLTRYCTI